MPLEGESRYCCIRTSEHEVMRWYIVELFFSGGGQQYTVVDTFKSSLIMKLEDCFRCSVGFWHSFVYLVGDIEPECRGFLRGDLFGTHDQFEKLPAMQSYRILPASVIIGDVLYVFGGGDLIPTDDIYVFGECYDLSEGVDSRWKPLKSPPKEYTLRSDLYALANGKDQIILGDKRAQKNIIIYCIKSDSWIELSEARPFTSSTPLLVTNSDVSDIIYYFDNDFNNMCAYDLKRCRTYKTQIWYNDRRLGGRTDGVDFRMFANPPVMHVSGDTLFYVSVEKHRMWGTFEAAGRPEVTLVHMHFIRFSVSELCQEEDVDETIPKYLREPRVMYCESRTTKSAVIDNGFSWEDYLEARLLEHKGRCVYPTLCLEKLFCFKFKDLQGRVHMLNYGIEKLGELVSAVSLRMDGRNDECHLQLLYEDGKGDEVLLITNNDLISAVSHARSVGQRVLNLHLDFSQRKSAMMGRRSKSKSKSKWVLASAAVVIPSFVVGVAYYLKPTAFISPVGLKFNKHMLASLPKVAEFLRCGWKILI